MNTQSKYTELSKSNTWATFFLSGEMFALPVEDVQEVMMYQPLTPVPLAPPHICGLLNLRGQIMPAIDLRRRLDVPPRNEQGTGSLLVVKTATQLVSVLVDEIGDVLPLPQDGWRRTPDTMAARYRTFVFGICPIRDHIVLGLRVHVLEDETALLGAA